MGRVVNMAEAGNYKPAATGDYVLEFTGGEWVKIKNGPNTGEDMYKAKFVIQDEVDANGEPVQGKVIYHNWNTMPKSLWVYFRDAAALGASKEDLENPALDLEVHIPTLVGRKALGHVTTSEYRYPEGHSKFGQSRFSNDIESLEALDVPEALQPAGRRGR